MVFTQSSLFFRSIFPQSLNIKYSVSLTNQSFRTRDQKKSISDVLIPCTSSVCNGHVINANAYGTVPPFSYEKVLKLK